MTYKSVFILLFIFTLPLMSSAQCMTVERPLEDLLNQATLVVEGKVVSQQGYWDTENKNIYTVHQITLFKSFKGVPINQDIQVVTQGGVVDLSMDKVSHALELNIGQMGLFLLQPSFVNLGLGTTAYKPVENALGFISYDLHTGTAHSVFERYSDIQGSFYTLL